MNLASHKSLAIAGAALACCAAASLVRLATRPSPDEPGTPLRPEAAPQPSAFAAGAQSQPPALRSPVTPPQAASPTTPPQPAPAPRWNNDLSSFINRLRQSAPLASWTSREAAPAFLRVTVYPDPGGLEIPFRVEEFFASEAVFRSGSKPLRTRVAAADRLVVESEAGLERLRPVLAAAGADWTMSPAPGLHIVRVRRAAADWRRLERAAARLARSELIGFTEKDYVTFPAYDPPNDPNFSQQWALADIDVRGAWDLSSGHPKVVVAVVDTGVDPAHPELAHCLCINPGEQGLDAQGRDKSSNGVDDDGNRYVDDWRGWDFGGTNSSSTGDNDPTPRGSSPPHGTQIAGVIAAQRNNAAGIAGIVPDISILPLKVCFDSTGTALSSHILSAQRYIADFRKRTGLHCVANFSWDLFQNSDTTTYKEDIKLSAAGIHSVWAAGNGGLNIDSAEWDSFYTTSRLWAQLPCVLTVGASTPRATRRGTSNYGRRSVHLFAPGESILSTSLGGGYATVNGTSFAAPHVAAVAALVRSIYPGVAGSAIKDVIINSVTPTAALAGLCAANGRLNARQAAVAGRGLGLAAFRMRALGIDGNALVAELRRPLLRAPYTAGFEASPDMMSWAPCAPETETLIESGETEVFSCRMPIQGSARFFRSKAYAPGP